MIQKSSSKKNKKQSVGLSLVLERLAKESAPRKKTTTRAQQYPSFKKTYHCAEMCHGFVKHSLDISGI
jgi:hypothetical protein